MTDLLPTNVPPVDDDWIATRRDHLISELTRTPAPHRRLSRRRIAGGIGALTAAGAASVAGLLIAGGPAASNAFAGWSATPTQPTSGEVSDAVANCMAVKQPPPGAVTGADGGAGSPTVGPPSLTDPSSWQLEVSDVRGPFSMLLFSAGDNTGQDSTVLCIAGPTFKGVSVAPSVQGSPGDGTIAIDRFSTTVTTQGGDVYTFVEGRAGSSVTAASLTLDDGTPVAVTLGDGHFVAWWPGQHSVSSAQVTTVNGTTTQPLSLPQGDGLPPTPRAGAGIGGGEASGSASGAGITVSCVIDGVARSGADCPRLPQTGATTGGVVRVEGSGQVEGQTVITGGGAGGGKGASFSASQSTGSGGGN